MMSEFNTDPDSSNLFLSSYNALSASELDAVAALSQGPADLLRRAADRHQLSSRAILSVRRVARTVADLRSLQQIDRRAMATALALRAGLA